MLNMEGEKKNFHANLLKKFYRRENGQVNNVLETMLEKNILSVVNNVVLDEITENENIEEKFNDIVHPFENNLKSPQVNEKLSFSEKKT